MSACAAVLGARSFILSRSMDLVTSKQAPEGSKYAYIDASMRTPSFTTILDDELAELSGNPLVR